MTAEIDRAIEIAELAALTIEGRIPGVYAVESEYAGYGQVRSEFTVRLAGIEGTTRAEIAAALAGELRRLADDAERLATVEVRIAS